MAEWQFHIEVTFEVVAEVENLTTLRTEFLVAIHSPLGTTLQILEEAA
jgi:hypothetical protein